MSARYRPSGLPLLLRVLQDPSRLSSLSPAEWEGVLSAAEPARLSGRLAADAFRVEAQARAPSWARDRLTSARIRGREFERVVLWEINRILRALDSTGLRPVFLKGAGYLAAGLPSAAGRVVSDVDVLVPEADLETAQSALERQGWAFVEQTPYDERYYRQWMHELPPMRHRQRGTMLDVHHAILPRTGRFQPDSRVLLERAVRAGGTYVLCPTHMVLHAAVHLFYDGAAAIRDLADIDCLVRYFATAEADFWPALLDDARELDLERSAFYALRYAHRILATPIPHEFWAELERAAPARPVLRVMDTLVDATLRERKGGVAAASSFGLYVRSHWLRMPPLLLVRHLAHQALVRK